MENILCLVKHIKKYRETTDESDLWLDLDDEPYPLQNNMFLGIEILVLPLYNHPHNDIENGQKEIHYHQDTRYEGNAPILFKSFKNGRIVLPLEDGEKLEFKKVKKIKEEELFTTPSFLISKSKIKHKCIHKGKCPHRGFNLSNVTPILKGEGREAREIIICPLHGLEFDSATKVLITKI
jgi:nitrite reductase/ring-hydroxylating ferredoxin subunit